MLYQRTPDEQKYVKFHGFVLEYRYLRLNSRSVGRRGCLFVAAVCYAVGVILQTVGIASAGFIVGRVLLGIAIGLISNSVSLIFSSLHPPVAKLMSFRFRRTSWSVLAEPIGDALWPAICSFLPLAMSWHVALTTVPQGIVIPEVGVSDSSTHACIALAN